MKNTQPFITTDWEKEFDEDFHQRFGKITVTLNEVNEYIYPETAMIKWSIERTKSLLSTQKERLIKEVGKMPENPLTPTNCGEKNEYIDKFNAGYNLAKEEFIDILRRLQSV